MGSQLCLSWNNHNIAFNKLLTGIYLQDLYSDGTILCHGKIYPVHRFVLSTCSEYFEDVFHQCLQLNNKHPVIVVKEVLPEQMEAILNYMYKGEVSVPQDILPKLMKAAEDLKIRGLVIPDEEPSPEVARKRSLPCSPVPPSKRIRSQKEMKLNSAKDIEECDSLPPSTSTASHDTTNPENQSYLKIKSEPVDSLDHLFVDDSQRGNGSEKHDDNIEAFDDTLDPFDVTNESSSWENVQAFDEDRGDIHPPDTIEPIVQISRIDPKLLTQMIWTPLGWQCTQCNYCSKRKSSTKRHFLKHTGEKNFQCPICPFRSSTKSDLMNKHVPACVRRNKRSMDKLGLLANFSE